MGWAGQEGFLGEVGFRKGGPGRRGGLGTDRGRFNQAVRRGALCSEAP